MDCGSNKDRHADLGEGKLGRDTISRILKHPKLKNMPFILETPALKSSGTIVKEVQVLKDLAK
jgi:deoxyribonuclease IV